MSHKKCSSCKKKSKCEPSTDKKYKDRPSPPYPANDYPNEIKEGNDKNSYISRADKNGTHKWIKFKEMDQCDTAEDYYLQFGKYEQKYDIKKIAKAFATAQKELEKEHIYLRKIGWKTVWDFVDNAEDDCIEELLEVPYIKNLLKKSKMPEYEILDVVSYLFFSDFNQFWATVDGALNIQHRLLKKDKKKFIEIMEKYLGQNFVWNGKEKQTIVIKFPKI